jgi:hypothetical protein
MKFIVTALAVLGAAYLIIMYAGSLFQKVAFTTGPTGPISWAACGLCGLGVLMLAKLTWK